MSRDSDKRSPVTPAAALRAWFEHRPLGELGDLTRALQASGRTVFRALKEVGYHSSYSHSGRYYTLRGIPGFDAQGLWFCRDACFSAAGTLRSTVERIVKLAPAGLTHDELRATLRLRVHDTLRVLVQADLIARERVGALYVYVDTGPELAQAQLAARRRRTANSVEFAVPPLDSARVIDVLLTVIRERVITAPAVGRALRARGVVVTDVQVDEVLTRYELQKKTVPSRSRRSPR